MEKSGWVKFVRDNALGDNEFLTFTHKGKMRFTVNIFKQDGKEMLQPPQSMASMASSSKICYSDYEVVNSIKTLVESLLLMMKQGAGALKQNKEYLILPRQ